MGRPSEHSRASRRNGREELKRLQRENVELKRANEIPRKASTFFAQADLDHRAK
jgi:transposase